MKSPLIFCALAALLLGLAGCGPSAKETELENKNQALQAELAKARQSESAARQKLDETSKKLDEAGRKLDDLQAQAQVDMTYVVLRREYTEGKLVATETLDTVSAKPVMARVSPRWRVYFQGVQTKREYPAIDVTESAYAQFAEGAVYTRDDIKRARK